MKDAYTVEAESESERLRSNDYESQSTESDGIQVDQRAASAPAEHGMEISNDVGQTAVSIGQHVSTPQTFFSRFGRPNPLFESAWPFDFPPTIVGVSLEVRVPTRPNLSQDASHHVPKEQAIACGGSHDVCRPEHGKIRASTLQYLLAWLTRQKALHKHQQTTLALTNIRQTKYKSPIITRQSRCKRRPSTISTGLYRLQKPPPSHLSDPSPRRVGPQSMPKTSRSVEFHQSLS